MDADRLASSLLKRAWPGGSSDRRDPVALGWVRRWGPRRVTRLEAACECATGRCGICN